MQAQTLTQGAIEGIVRDAAGNPLGGVVVTLNDRGGNGTTSRTSGKDGRFVLGMVPPGEYDLLLEAFGHRPLRIQQVPVNAGQETRVDYVLKAADTNAGGVIERRYYIASDRTASEHFSADDLGRFPEDGRLLTSALRLSSNADPQLENEGLPGRFLGVRLDGLPIGITGSQAKYLPVTLPLSFTRTTELLTGSADVEWSGNGSAVLSAHSPVAGNRLQFKTFGDWSSASFDQAGLTSPEHNAVRAGGVIAGPLVRDTVSIVLGGEFWRIDAPIAYAPRLDSITGRVLQAAEDAYGINDGSITPERLSRISAFTGFGRFDWVPGRNSRLHFLGAVTALPEAQAPPVTGEWAGPHSVVRGSDLSMSTGLDSRFGQRFGQQLRIFWNRSLRDHNVDAANAMSGSTTFFVRDGLGIGEDPLQVGRREAQAFGARATLHYWGTRHHIKGGFSADITSLDVDFGGNRATRFWFSDPDAFANGLGYAQRSDGTAQASFDLPRIGLFLQDEWTVGSRARMLLGLRWDFDRLPAQRFRLNTDWLRLTGISVELDSIKARHGRIAPRFEFEWQPDVAGRWTVRANGGIWNSEIDYDLIAEAIAFNGSTNVRRGFGRFQDWPTATDSGAMPTLTLLTTGHQAPRSTRLGGGISNRLAPGIDWSITVAYRRTAFLPRRSDANRVIASGVQDQYGRTIFGMLEQQGSVLAAAGGSDRRFAPFDVVSVVGVDGWSEYRAVSATVRAQVSTMLSLRAGYTYSRTDDNWLMAREGNTAAAIPPLSQADAPDWSESVSDFDTPHRAVVGAELSTNVLAGIRASALFRYRSGHPFTPGFRDGVDANGDGSMRNDPAFIDPELPGFAAVADQFACIRAQAGRFAARNSCRGPAARGLDLRLAIGVYRTQTRSAEILIDALNLLSSGTEQRDHALYLIDADRSLIRDGSTVQVPLVVNPSFGAPLLRTAPGEMLRLGFRVTR